MSERSPITTHVLDTSVGRPAVGVNVSLSGKSEDGDAWRVIGSSETNADGRVTDLMRGPAEPGVYQLTFQIGDYYGSRGIKTFYPAVSIAFTVSSATEHYHVPLLINPFGYSTYRGT